MPLCRLGSHSVSTNLERVTMPTGLVEGTETIVLFTIALALPQRAGITFAVMAGGLAIGVAQRAVAARGLLHND